MANLVSHERQLQDAVRRFLDAWDTGEIVASKAPNYLEDVNICVGELRLALRLREMD